MTAEFRTSFIPKKTLAKKQQAIKPPVSLLLVVSTFVFLVTAGAAGGLYAYRIVLEKRIDEQSAALQRSERAFDPRLITALKNLDLRLSTAKKLVNTHTAISPVFTFLEQTTLRSVQFTKLHFENTPGSPVLALQGSARDFMSLALQSDIYSQHEMIQQAVFSEFEASPEGDSVSFRVEMFLNPGILSYREYFSNIINGTP